MEGLRRSMQTDYIMKVDSAPNMNVMDPVQYFLQCIISFLPSRSWDLTNVLM